jgi:hypothetical protein
MVGERSLRPMCCCAQADHEFSVSTTCSVQAAGAARRVGPHSQLRDGEERAKGTRRARLQRTRREREERRGQSEMCKGWRGWCEGWWWSGGQLQRHLIGRNWQCPWHGARPRRAPRAPLGRRARPARCTPHAACSTSPGLLPPPPRATARSALQRVLERKSSCALPTHMDTRQPQRR